MPRMILDLDDDDYRTIQRAIARYQAESHAAFGKIVLPEGTSDTPGAIIGELLRDLEDYRYYWELLNPPEPTP